MPGENNQQFKSLDELINKEDPAWPLVEDWVAAAANPVEILPCDATLAATALHQLQVTTRSPMGAIVFHTGGILVDHGWLRILGSGHARLNRSLPAWNVDKGYPGYLIIADDAIGGYFAVNGGELGDDAGKVYYFAPDTMDWEPLQIGYTDFIQFCFSGKLADFYGELRWDNWEQEVSALHGNEVFNFYPLLMTEEAKADINAVSRRPISVEEQYDFNFRN